MNFPSNLNYEWTIVDVNFITYCEITMYERCQHCACRCSSTRQQLAICRQSVDYTITRVFFVSNFVYKWYGLTSIFEMAIKFLVPWHTVMVKVPFRGLSFYVEIEGITWKESYLPRIFRYSSLDRCIFITFTLRFVIAKMKNRPWNVDTNTLFWALRFRS